MSIGLCIHFHLFFLSVPHLFSSHALSHKMYPCNTSSQHLLWYGNAVLNMSAAGLFNSPFYLGTLSVQRLTSISSDSHHRETDLISSTLLSMEGVPLCWSSTFARHTAMRYNINTNSITKQGVRAASWLRFVRLPSWLYGGEGVGNTEQVCLFTVLFVMK